jgi:hypothetical protein
MDAVQHAQLKGSVMAGYTRYLRERAWLEEVCAEVSPETAALLRTPPLAISWVDTVHARSVLDAVETLRGLDEVRRLGAVSLNEGVLKLMRPVLSGLVRATGASPHAIFGQIETAIRLAARGYVARYHEHGDHSGAVELTSRGVADSRAGLIGGWEAAFQSVLELTGVRGSVHLQGYEQRGPDTHSTFVLRWDPRRHAG